MLFQNNLIRQRGVVIIVALFIMALMASMAYVMMARLFRDTERTSLLLRNVQSELYAQGGIAWAMDQLRNDWEQQKPGQLIDSTPIRSPVDKMNGYQIVTTIYDMQGRLNLNNLTNPALQDDFKRLLQVIAPQLSEEKRNDIVGATMDWLALGTQKSVNDSYYAELPLPYRAAHRPMVSASELRLVKGMDAQLYQALQPYIVALPQLTQVNVQSAMAPVLMTLSPSMTLPAAKAIEKLRIQSPFVSTESFLDSDVMKNHLVPAEKITVTSNYFLVETEVSIDQQHLVLYTLLERMMKDDKVAIHRIWQSKGVW